MSGSLSLDGDLRSSLLLPMSRPPAGLVGGCRIYSLTQRPVVAAHSGAGHTPGHSR